MKKEDFEMLKTCTDYTEYHFINGKYYRAGSNGLSLHKRDRNFTKIGQCNSFRDMNFANVVSQLKSPL